jgi:hypothetical protein
MAFSISPDMNLPIPNVGTEPGPNYAFDVNNCLTLIDSHDHTPGKGVPITPDALNINASVDMQDESLINTMSIVFFLQNAQPAVSKSLYAFPGGESPALPDLWYYDGVTQIQITKAGTVNSTAASIPGESYSGGTFFWKQGSGSTTPANFDIGNITLRPNVASTTNGTTISGASSGAFSLVLPNASLSLFPSGLPASTVLNTTDASGNVSTLSAGTTGQVLESQGTAGPPLWTTPIANKAPTLQIFNNTMYYTFTVNALTVQTDAGAFYNNAMSGHTFVVVYTAAVGATTLVCSANGAPPASGLLTLSSGTGQGSITFTFQVSGASYQLPTVQTPLYIVVTGVGGGGGGTAGNSGGAASVGTSTLFGPASMLVAAGGGAGAGAGSGGGGGGAGSTTLSSGVILIAGGSGTGGSQSSGGTAPNGGAGGNSPFGGGGGGGGGNNNSNAGTANTGGGGGGAGALGTNPSGAGGGAGGYFKAYIPSPSASYTFQVGAGGAAGPASGQSGAAGGSGIIIVEEYYQ